MHDLKFLPNCNLMKYVLKDRNRDKVKPLLRGHPNRMSTPLERPLYNVNLNMNVLNFYP